MDVSAEWMLAVVIHGWLYTGYQSAAVMRCIVMSNMTTLKHTRHQRSDNISDVRLNGIKIPRYRTSGNSIP